MRSTVPSLRVTAVNGCEANPHGEFVLYWMIANRRPHFNFSLQHALDWCAELRRPLLVLEGLRADYQWASPRLHRFILDGMQANRQFFQSTAVTYYPYVETEKDAGKGLLASLAGHACIVITDDYPCFFLPRMVAAAADQLEVRFETVDSNGVLPMRATNKLFARAYDFRRFLQANLREHLADYPLEDPVRERGDAGGADIPRECRRRWAPARDELLAADAEEWKSVRLPEDIPPTEDVGGYESAQQRLERFVQSRLERYAEYGNHPEEKATSGLSPWLHFGFISSHRILLRVLESQGAEPMGLRPGKLGKVAGWWEVDENARQFLDQLLTWRELGFNMCRLRDDYMEYESLPVWARETLAEHEDDPREHLYELEEFEAAETHDPLWNAAQRQLLREGRIHNYLRMVWGKKILHWSESPRRALEIMIHLNDKYALDGRDPNSYSGIFWCLGRYDRPWGPERPIFGKVRYMTTANAARKYRVDQYLEEYGE